MTNLKPYLKSHLTGQDAVSRTTKSNVIAVVVKTYSQDTLVSKDFYSYKTKFPYELPNGEMQTLYEDFPLSLGSNQSIQEIDANDY